MNKFKVGDKVKIINGIGRGLLEKYVDTEGVISMVDDTGVPYGVRFKSDECTRWFYERNLEAVGSKPSVKELQEFALQCIGMRYTDVDGNQATIRRLVIEDENQLEDYVDKISDPIDARQAALNKLTEADKKVLGLL